MELQALKFYSLKQISVILAAGLGSDVNGNSFAQETSITCFILCCVFYIYKNVSLRFIHMHFINFTYTHTQTNAKVSQGSLTLTLI